MQTAATPKNDELTRVLIVDDETGPRESLALILRATYDVRTADSGEEAISILTEHPVDVITLDLRMPGLSGEETLAKIRLIDPNIEVIIVTGFGSYESAVEVLRLKVFDYLGKPFRTEQLLETIGRAADSHRNNQQNAGVGDLLPPFENLMGEIEVFSEKTSTRLPDIERVTLARIVGGLQHFNSRLHERLGPHSAIQTRHRRGGS